MNVTASSSNHAGSADAPFHDGRMLIGGRMVESVGGQWLESRNPANLQLIGRVPAANAEDAALAASELGGVLCGVDDQLVVD